MNSSEHTGHRNKDFHILMLIFGGYYSISVKSSCDVNKTCTYKVSTATATYLLIRFLQYLIIPDFLAPILQYDLFHIYLIGSLRHI